MLAGLDILLDRMKTNPDEFLNDERIPHEGEYFGGKWADLLDYAHRVGTEEERALLKEAMNQFYRDDFNGRVMRRLAGEEESPMTLKYKAKTDPRTAMQAAQKQALQNAALIGQAQIKAQGQPVAYGGIGISDSTDGFGYALGNLMGSGFVGSGSS